MTVIENINIAYVSLCVRMRQKSWSPQSVSMWQHEELLDIILGIRPRDSLVADEDVKKPNKHTPSTPFS